jgi:hypothetical protein
VNTTKVKVKEVWIRRAEGLPAECVELTRQSIAAADAALRAWALTAPEDGCYDKCDFKITFEDGDSYSGRYDLKRHDAAHSGLIGRHVRQHIEFYAGLWRPGHMTAEDHEKAIVSMESFSKAGREQYREFLEKYDLG